MSSYFGWELDKGDDTIATMLINGRLVYRGPAASVSSLYDEILAHFQIGEDAAAERISSLESQLAEAKTQLPEGMKHCTIPLQEVPSWPWLAHGDELGPAWMPDLPNSRGRA